MAKQSFSVGQVLTAAQMTSLQQTAMLGGAASAKTASYTLVAADAGTAVSMSNASATTITVNTALFAAGDTVQITNLGAGVCTITAGTATVNTAASLALAQYESGTLDFTSTSAAIFIKGAGGAVAALASASARVETAQELTSATYTDLATAGPAVTLTTGTKVLVIVSSQIYTTGSSQSGFMDFAISGATTRSATDSTAVAMTAPSAYVNEQYASRASRITVTAGSNTFTAKYRESGASQAGFQYREICVIDLGS
jgi:hypothetical protein